MLIKTAFRVECTYLRWHISTYLITSFPSSPSHEDDTLACDEYLVDGYALVIATEMVDGCSPTLRVPVTESSWLRTQRVLALNRLPLLGSKRPFEELHSLFVDPQHATWHVALGLPTPSMLPTTHPRGRRGIHSDQGLYTTCSRLGRNQSVRRGEICSNWKHGELKDGHTTRRISGEDTTRQSIAGNRLSRTVYNRHLSGGSLLN